MSFLPAVLADLLDLDRLRTAANFLQTLPAQDKQVITTMIVFEGLARLLYYLLIFLAVFLLGRRMIQGMIAGYREARAQSV